jgi:hypothetical protein
MYLERPVDRFVIPADPDLDSTMVIKADPRLDPAMVFHLGPDGRLARVTEEAAAITVDSDPEPEMIPQPLPQPR